MADDPRRPYPGDDRPEKKSVPDPPPQRPFSDREDRPSTHIREGGDLAGDSDEEY
jgi:hypothetical protein